MLKIKTQAENHLSKSLDTLCQNENPKPVSQTSLQEQSKELVENLRSETPDKGRRKSRKMASENKRKQRKTFKNSKTRKKFHALRVRIGNSLSHDMIDHMREVEQQMKANP